MGRTPSLNEQLNIGLPVSKKISILQARMLSGPVDVFVLTFRKAENVSSTIIINSSGN